MMRVEQTPCVARSLTSPTHLFAADHDAKDDDADRTYCSLPNIIARSAADHGEAAASAVDNDRTVRRAFLSYKVLGDFPASHSTYPTCPLILIIIIKNDEL